MEPPGAEAPGAPPKRGYSDTEHTIKLLYIGLTPSPNPGRGNLALLLDQGYRETHAKPKKEKLETKQIPAGRSSPRPTKRSGKSVQAWRGGKFDKLQTATESQTPDSLGKTFLK
jgi:hypothetical protein